MSEAMIDSSTAPCKTRIRGGHFWAAVLALIFSVQAVVAAPRANAFAADSTAISKPSITPAMASLRATALVAPVVAKGTKPRADFRSDDTPPLVPASVRAPFAQSAVGGSAARPLASPPLRGTGSEANGARAPPAAG